jgi:hypothetical protein
MARIGCTDLFLSMPVHPHEVPIFLVGKIKLTAESAFERLANSARQVNVCRRDYDAVRAFLDTDDAIHRVFPSLGFLLVPHQLQDLRLLRRKKITAQRNDTSWELVVDPMAGLA